MKLLILLLLCMLLAANVRGHGLMTEPPQRGILGGTKFAPGFKNPVRGAPRDVFAHFPAGDKDTTPGAGKRSQERQGNFNWKPFEPLKRGFRWRAGVCGDLKSASQDHLRGGKYYFNAEITRTYRRGGIVKVGTAIIAHHNGFIEMHVCDVKKCGGEISESCFRNGHCRLLNRARNRVCDSGLSKNCAPIDRNFPGRWYLPCTRNPKSGFDVYSPEFAQFVLPRDLTCDHCVLQWFWTSANNCNPPGVIEYFEGPDGPKSWGKCRGQAGALGGYTKVQKPCGGREFPEEYYQCADIRIMNDAARSGRGRGTPSTSKSEREPPASPSRSPSVSSTSGTAPSKRGNDKKNAKNSEPGNPVRNIKLIADGRVVKKLDRHNKFVNLKFKRLTFKVNTSREVKPIEFFINGRKVWAENNAPYYMFGNSGSMPHYWPSPILRRPFKLEVRAAGHSYKVTVNFVYK